MSGRCKVLAGRIFRHGVKAMDHVWHHENGPHTSIQDAHVAVFANWRFTKNEHQS